MFWVSVYALAEGADSLFLDALCTVRAIWDWGVSWKLDFLPDHVMLFCQRAVEVAAVHALGKAMLAPLPHRFLLGLRVEVRARVARILGTDIVFFEKVLFIAFFDLVQAMVLKVDFLRF